MPLQYGNTVALYCLAGSADVQVAALFSGCGQDATRAAVAASDIMAQRTANLLDNTEQLVSVL